MAMSDTNTVAENTFTPSRDFLAVAMDEASLGAIQQLAQNYSWPMGAIQRGNSDTVESYLTGSHIPRFVVVDVDGAQGSLDTLLSLAEQTTVIVIGSVNDVSLYRTLTGGGVAEYLLKPIQPEMIEAAINASVSKKASSKGSGDPALRGKFTFFIGTRGGVGASTLAAYTAWEVSNLLKSSPKDKEEKRGKKDKNKAALVDLDLNFGTSTLLLDAEPNSNFISVLHNPDRIDSLLISTAGRPVNGDALVVFGSEEAPDNPADFTAYGCETFLDGLGGTFEHVLVDLPKGEFPSLRDTLRLANTICIVTDLTLASIRDCTRLINSIKGLGTPAKVLIMASRVHPKDRPGQIDRTTFEKNIEQKLDFVFPEDFKTISSSANAGRVVGEVAPNAQVSKMIGELARRLTGVEEGEKKQGFLDKLKAKK